MRETERDTCSVVVNARLGDMERKKTKREGDTLQKGIKIKKRRNKNPPRKKQEGRQKGGGRKKVGV